MAFGLLVEFHGRGAVTTSGRAEDAVERDVDNCSECDFTKEEQDE